MDLDRVGLHTEVVSILRGELKECEAERDNLRAEVERLRGKLAVAKERENIGMDTWKYAAERAHARECEAINRAEAAEAHAAELRAALEDINQTLTAASASSVFGYLHRSVEQLLPKARLALASTPAQSLAAVQARALRELKSRIVECDQCGEVVFWSVVENKAERLEKEAGDAQTKD